MTRPDPDDSFFVTIQLTLELQRLSEPIHQAVAGFVDGGRHDIVVRTDTQVVWFR